MSKVYYARWYSGVDPAVFRLHWNPEGGVTLAERWGANGWEPEVWDEIQPWVDYITPEDLPPEVAP